MREKSKVLFLVQLPPPHHGAAYMNKRITELIGEMNIFDTKVLNLSKAKSSDDIGSIKLNKIFRVLLTYFQLIKLLVFFRPNLVFFNFSSRGIALIRDYFYILILKVFRLDYVLYLQIGGFDKRAEAHKLWKFMYKSSFRNARIVTLSQRLSEELVGLADYTPLVLPNGIEPNKLRLKLREKPDGGLLKLLFLSNLMFEKGIFDVIEALGKLHKQGFSFELQIIGAEADVSASDLNQAIESHGISGSTYYIGSKYDDEKWKALLEADVFIFPSHNEALPLVLLEAMSCELPIVASQIGGVPDLIEDGISGLLFKPQNVAELSEKLLLLLRDSSLRQRMASNAKEKFDSFYTTEHFEERLKDLFVNLTTGNKQQDKVLKV